MANQISMAFGSGQILTSIQKNNPNRNLVMYSSTNKINTAMLLDISGERSVFNSPVIFDILAKVGEDDNNNFVNFITLDLNFDQQKVFDARINLLMSTDLPSKMNSMYSMHYNKDISKRVILTTWNDQDDFRKWEQNEVESWRNQYSSSPTFYFDSASYQKTVNKKV